MQRTHTKEIPILYSTMMVQAKLAIRKHQTRRLVKHSRAEHHKDETFPGEVHESPDCWRPVANTEGYSFENGVIYAGDPDEGDLNCYVDFRTSDVDARWMACIRCPYGQPGDLHWIRESALPDFPKGFTYYDNTWQEVLDEYRIPKHVIYKASWPKNYSELTWKPSIHMPKWASRIWDKVIALRIERLHDISEADAIAEGIVAITKDGGRTYKFGIPAADGLPAASGEDGWPWDQWKSTAVEAYLTLWESLNGRESREANPWVWVITTETLSTTGKPALSAQEAAES